MKLFDNNSPNNQFYFPNDWLQCGQEYIDYNNNPSILPDYLPKPIANPNVTEPDLVNPNQNSNQYAHINHSLPNLTLFHNNEQNQHHLQPILISNDVRCLQFQSVQAKRYKKIFIYN
jgi:hypothetical protein